MNKKIAVLFGVLALGPVSLYAAVTQFHSLGSVQLGTSTVNGGLALPSFDKAQLRLLIPHAVGAIVYCNNCNFGTLMVSSGTGRGAWVAISSSTAANGGNL